MHDHSRFQRDIDDVTGVSLSLCLSQKSLTHNMGSASALPIIDVCLSRRISFFQRTKLTKERHRRRKLNTTEPPDSFLPRNRPRKVPSAAPPALRSVYFAVETWPRALLY